MLTRRQYAGSVRSLLSLANCYHITVSFYFGNPLVFIPMLLMIFFFVVVSCLPYRSLLIHIWFTKVEGDPANMGAELTFVRVSFGAVFLSAFMGKSSDVF